MKIRPKKEKTTSKKKKVATSKTRSVALTKTKAVGYFKKVCEFLKRERITDTQFINGLAIGLRELTITDAKTVLEFLKKEKLIESHARYYSLKSDKKKSTKKKIITADGRELLTKLPTKKTVSVKDGGNFIKPWYHKAYPTDPMWRDIKANITFDAVWNLLKTGNGHDFYDFTGAQDSVVRERIFEELAKRKKVSYGKIYDMWLGE